MSKLWISKRTSLQSNFITPQVASQTSALHGMMEVLSRNLSKQLSPRPSPLTKRRKSKLTLLLSFQDKLQVVQPLSLLVMALPTPTTSRPRARLTLPLWTPVHLLSLQLESLLASAQVRQVVLSLQEADPRLLSDLCSHRSISTIWVVGVRSLQIVTCIMLSFRLCTNYSQNFFIRFSKLKTWCWL